MLLLNKIKIIARHLVCILSPKLCFRRSIYHYNKYVKEAKDKKDKILKNANWFKINEILEKKKSNKIFILGSGRSICDLSDKDWNEIEKNDSLSLNFNVLLDHIPTFLMFEMADDKNRKDIFIHWLNKRAEEYRKKETVIILRDITSDNFCYGDLPSSLEYLCYVKEQIPLHSPTKNSLEKSLHLVDDFIIKNDKNCIPTYKASLFSACYIAALLDYEEIYLVGFDLNNTDYFYTDSSFKNRPVPTTGMQGKIHKTALSSTTSLSVSDALKILNEIILKKRNIKLYVTNPKSLLATHLEVRSIRPNK